MQLFGVLADVGLFTTVVREISKDPSRTEELVGNTIALRLVLSIVVIALAAAVSLLLPYEHDVRVAILLAGAPLLFGMLTTSFVAVLQSRLRMGRAVIGDVVGRAVSLGLVLAVVGLDLGFYAVLGAAAGGALATLLVTWRADTRGSRRCARCIEPAGLALAAQGRAPAGPGAGDQRALLPRRHADHLALRAVRPGRPLHARLPRARAGAGGRHGLPHHHLPDPVGGGGPRRGARAAHDPGLDRGVRGAGRAAGGRRAGAGAADHRAGRRRGLPRRRHAAAHPARGRRAGLGQRRVRLRADRPRPAGQRALAQLLGARLQRRRSTSC